MIVRQRLTDYFELERSGSNLRREVLAGVSTFLALAYIIVVNAAILGEAGMDSSVVVFATILASGLATVAMGVWARLPFALAPGLEMSIFVSFVVVGTMGFTWQQALGAVFWSGVLFMILNLARVRQKIIEAIPDRMRSGIAFSVGLFIALIALRTAGILEYEGTTPSGFGSFFGPRAVALYAGTALILLLLKLRIRAAVLISILAMTVFCHLMGVDGAGENPVRLSSAMLAGTGALDLSVVLDPRLWSVIVLLFVIDFYGSVAKLIGLTNETTIVQDGKLPRIGQALSIDGTATMFGAGLGTTSITTFVESGVGIGAGGRTGIVAVVCGGLMLSCFVAAPFVSYVPIEATTGALIYVAIQLSPGRAALGGYKPVDVLALAVMSVVVITTFALDRAMLAAFVIYLVADSTAGLARGRLRMPNPYLVFSVVVLLISTVLQLQAAG